MLCHAGAQCNAQAADGARGTRTARRIEPRSGQATDLGDADQEERRMREKKSRNVKGTNAGRLRKWGKIGRPESKGAGETPNDSDSNAKMLSLYSSNA